MNKHSNEAASVAGVAEVAGFPQSGDKIQVHCKNITTGTGTVTITVKLGDSTTFTNIVGGTIALSSPIGLVIEGCIKAVKATSSSALDVFELEVNS